MPAIRDLVAALRRRDGVDAAVVLSRDGLVIDGQAGPGLDAERLAAMVPSVLSAADDVGTHAAAGALATGVLEYAERVLVASVLSGDVVLLVVARATADVGALLFELRRNRTRFAALV
jgi:predicted regulator of Ras-like GTPase activity (Roadblock/LC7/MglB family)